MHKILTNTTYKGDYRFNRRVWKTKQAKAEAEQVSVPVDPIIDEATFDAVQALLKARNPKAKPPRTVTGPILLTGIATCASCGGGMTLRTGKSGRYRYYTCATSAQQGKSACRGRSVPMDRLDDAVTSRLSDQLLTPDRVERLLAGLLERQAAKDSDCTQRLTALREKLTETERRLKRLYEAIETGAADPADPLLKDRIAALRTERDIAQASFDRASAELRPEVRITDDKIAAFARVMRENICHGEIPFRRAYIRAVVDQVEVDDCEIRIRGRRTVLERLVMGGGATPSGVPSFVRKWRARQGIDGHCDRWRISIQHPAAPQSTYTTAIGRST